MVGGVARDKAKSCRRGGFLNRLGQMLFHFGHIETEMSQMYKLVYLVGIWIYSPGTRKSNVGQRFKLGTIRLLKVSGRL